MKNLLLISFFCSILLNTYAQKTYYVKIASPSEITCGDSLQLVAEVVTPVHIKVVSAGYSSDGIGLQVVEKNSNTVVIEDLYIWVISNTTVDSVIYLKEGSYILKWAYGGAEVLNPEISGSVGDWTIVDQQAQIEFKVDSLVDPKNVTYIWPDLESDHSSVKIAPVNTGTYKVIATYIDSTVVENRIKVTVNPLTATVENKNISCGNRAQLNVITNYTGTGTLSYNWIPSTGLSAADIPDPVAELLSATDYVVNVETPNGCSAKDTVNVSTSVISFDPEICFVTVNENDKNVITWKNELNEAIDSFFIYKESSDQTDRFDLIGTVPVNGDGTFVDSASNARVQSNKYKMAVKDICGFITDKSPEHKTMHLTINRGIGNTWNLIWEQYVGVPVSSYRIYRGTTRANLESIGTSSGSNTTYTDETAPQGDVYYQIEVILPVDCSLQKSASWSSSRSNIFSSAEATTDIHNTASSKVYLYPNPAKDKLFIRNGQSGKSVIFIYDLKGNLVLNRKTDTNFIDISGLERGIYTVRLVNSGNVFISKLVKE